MYLDILILIIFIFGILTGIRNGIFIEIISVFGFAINLLITKIYTPVVFSPLASIIPLFSAFETFCVPPIVSIKDAIPTEFSDFFTNILFR